MRYTGSMSYPERLLIIYVDSTAIGDESKKIVEERERSIEHYLIPSSTQWHYPQIRFSKLKEEWENATAALSSISDISMHPSYQQIIGMGPIAILMILGELQEKPQHWFWALKCITGEDPVPPELRGRTKEMAKIWIEWGKKQGYISE